MGVNLLSFFFNILDLSVFFYVLSDLEWLHQPLLYTCSSIFCSGIFMDFHMRFASHPSGI